MFCLTGGATAQFSVVGPQTLQPVTSVVPPASPATDTLVELNGIARSTANAPVRFAPLRLRNARTGHIVGVTTADQNGAFTFGSVRPGFYVVEITDNAGRVLATSPLISANAGDVVATLIKLPTRFLAGGFFNGGSVAGAATGGTVTGASVGAIAAVTSAAASAGVLAVTIVGRPISPEQ